MNLRKLRRRVYRKSGGGPNIGNRCKDFEPGCIICQSWKFKDDFGRFPRSFDELGNPKTGNEQQEAREELEQLAMDGSSVSGSATIKFA